ncbi:MAG: HAD family hydrolase [Alphaproteobacteria bacterium]|nr:HAD family hydrolase [Alphaproteobacteria bacterium]
MFGEDRFDAAQDFAKTFREVSNIQMTAEEINTIILDCCNVLFEYYRDPEHYDDFPSVAEVLAGLPSARQLPNEARDAMEAVLARHELGQVPRAHAEVLIGLAGKHRLALLSNLWSRKRPWLAALAEAGVGGLFEAMLFSSETRSIKPSSRLFNILLEKTLVLSEKAVYIGDDLARDVAGAQAAGLASVWLSHGRNRDPDQEPVPDREVPSLLELSLLDD